jgi:hypothetical protein
MVHKRVQFWLAGVAGEAVVRVISATWRVKRVAPPNLEQRIRSGRKRVILAFWHRHLLSMLGGFKAFPFCVPVSEHADGEYVARVMERFGILAVRGSTTRGRLRLIRGLLGAVEGGRSCAITPDGPRGPCYHVHAGFVLIARRTGLPVYPLGLAVDRRWELPSWDSFVIPQPLARICVVAGEPLSPERLDETPVRESCRELRRRMMQATKRAQEEL